MSLTATVLNGGGTASATVDISTRLRTDLGLQLGNRAFMGEAAQSSFYIDDDDGEYGNSEDLPAGTALSIAAHNVVTFSETQAGNGTAVLMRGRVIPKEIGRGDKYQDRGRQLVVRLDDYNSDLKGIVLLSEQARSAETDIARVTWVFDTYLSGSPRITTDLTSGIVNTSPVTMPAKTYPVGTPILEIIGDCAIAAEKTFFVMVDGTFYYAPHDDTSQRAGLRISDRDDEIDFTCSGSSGGTIYSDDFESYAVGGTAHQGIQTSDFDVSDGGTKFLCIGSSTGSHGFPSDEDASWGAAGTATIPVTAGVTYTVTARVAKRDAGPNAEDQVGIEWRDETLGSPSTSTVGTPTTLKAGEWANAIWYDLSATVVAPENAHFMTLFFTAVLDGWYLGSVSVVEAASNDCTFPPIWTGPASVEDGQGLLSGGVLRYDGDTVVTETRSSVADLYDYWVETINDTGAVGTADAATRLSAILNLRQYEERTYNVAVQLHRSQVHLLKAGQMIDIKARAIPDADDQYRTRRIASLEWQWIGPEHYLAVMELDRPANTRGAGPAGGIGGGGQIGSEALVKANAGIEHINATSDAHDASEITIADAGGYFIGTDVEGALQELGANAGGGTTMLDRLHGKFLAVYHRASDTYPLLMASDDGVTFTDVGSPLLGAVTMRDPSIIHWDGAYWLCGTIGAAGATTIYTSTDLVTWTSVVTLTSIGGGNRAWAPEWIRNMDGTPYLHPDTGFPSVTINISTDAETTFTIREMHPTNRGMTSWSSTTTITGTSLPTKMIDGFLLVDGDDYWLWYKNEGTDKRIEIAHSSTALTSGYTVLESGDWAGWYAAKDAGANSIEGPCVIRLDDGRWRIYFNENNGLSSIRTVYSETTDDWRTGTSTWTTQAEITTDAQMSHGSVIFLPGIYDHMRDPDAHADLVADLEAQIASAVPAGHYEVVVSGNPAAAVTTEDGTDWVYGWVA